MENPTPDQVALSMQRYYERAFNEIWGILSAAKKHDSYWRKARQAQLLKQIGEILDDFTSLSSKHMEKAMLAIAEYETKLALDDLQGFKEALANNAKWHLEYNQKQVEHAVKDTYQHIAGQTQRMKNTIKQQLRQESAEVFRMAAVKGIPRAKAYRQLRDAMLTKHPSFEFIDKAGRRWDSRTYFDMMTHTVMATAQRDAYQNTCANEGIDLVIIPQNGAKDACKRWEGKVLSLTGATPGYPTLQEATGSGEIFHPRCRHRFVAYHPDVEEVFQQVAA